MKETLSVGNLEDAEKEDIPVGDDSEDEINKSIEEMMKRSGRLPNVSFFRLHRHSQAQDPGTFRHTPN